MDYGIDHDFKTWFSECVKVGGIPNPTDLDPNGRLADRDVFINVCDVRDGCCEQQMLLLGARPHWFPLGEIVGLCVGSIYGALNVLFTAYARNWSVYLHCAAGINRSQTVADCFYYMMTSEHRPKPAHWHHIGNNEQTGVMLKRNCQRGKLQPLPVMEAWLKAMAGTISCIGGGELDGTRMAAGFPWGEPKEEMLSGPISLL
jgi:hypothetical protein